MWSERPASGRDDGKEISMENQPEWRTALRTAVFVHVAIVAAVFLYAVILEVLKATLRPMPRLAAGTNIQVLRYVFYGLAVVAVIAVRLVNRGMFHSRPGESFSEAIHRLSRTAILTSILCGAPAGLGLILVFLTGTVRDFYYLLFVSLILTFMYFPRSRTWTEILRERFPRENV
jgi:hypothetical protein